MYNFKRRHCSTKKCKIFYCLWIDCFISLTIKDKKVLLYMEPELSSHHLLINLLLQISKRKLNITFDEYYFWLTKFGGGSIGEWLGCCWTSSP